MKDKEIVKALRLCLSDGNLCDICPMQQNYDTCKIDAVAADLIEQQAAEIKSLHAKIEKAYFLAWDNDIPSPTVSEYIELHNALQSVMHALINDDDSNPTQNHVSCEPTNSVMSRIDEGLNHLSLGIACLLDLGFIPEELHTLIVDLRIKAEGFRAGIAYALLQSK